MCMIFTATNIQVFYNFKIRRKAFFYVWKKKKEMSEKNNRIITKRIWSHFNMNGYNVWNEDIKAICTELWEESSIEFTQRSEKRTMG